MTLVGLSLHGDNRRLGDARGLAEGLARGAPIERLNCRKPTHHYLNSEDDSEVRDVLKLKKDLPMRRKGIVKSLVSKLITF